MASVHPPGGNDEDHMDFVFFFFSSRLFAAIGLRSRSCFTGQLPGIGTVFILASLQMCKVQGKVH